MNIEVLRQGAELSLEGRLDAERAPSVREALHRAIERGRGDLVVHIAGLEIWDGTGLGVLAGASRRTHRAGRRLVLTGVGPRELRLLRVARVPRRARVMPAHFAAPRPAVAHALLQHTPVHGIPRIPAQVRPQAS